MAREFALVSTSIWNSRKFCALESDDAKLLFFYLMSCPSVNSLGCYVLKPGYAMADLGWDAIRYQYGIDSLSKVGLIGMDTQENVVRIIGFLDHSPIMNFKHGTGATKMALALPDCSEKACLFKELGAQRFIDQAVIDAEILRISDTVSIPYQNGIDIPIPIPIPRPIPRPIEKREAIASSKKTLGARLQADWFLPMEWGEWALNEGMTAGQIRSQADTFKDYWTAKAGKDAAKTDWQATWRNWCRKFIADQGKGKTHGNQNAAFGATINAVADGLTAGTIRLDNSRSDPFAPR